MDKLGQALKLVDKALADWERPVVPKHKVAQCALWLGAAATLALVDLAASLRTGRILGDNEPGG